MFLLENVKKHFSRIYTNALKLYFYFQYYIGIDKIHILNMNECIKHVKTFLSLNFENK